MTRKVTGGNSIGNILKLFFKILIGMDLIYGWFQNQVWALVSYWYLLLCLCSMKICAPLLRTTTAYFKHPDLSPTYTWKNFNFYFEADHLGLLTQVTRSLIFQACVCEHRYFCIKFLSRATSILWTWNSLQKMYHGKILCWHVFKSVHIAITRWTSIVIFLESNTF